MRMLFSTERNSGMSQVLEGPGGEGSSCVAGGDSSPPAAGGEAGRVTDTLEVLCILRLLLLVIKNLLATTITLSQAKVVALSPSLCLALNFANMHECRVLKFRFMVPKFMVLRINKKLLWWLRAGYPINPES